MLDLLRYAFNKNTPSPLYLIHFVTNLCNARCPHCFIVRGEPRKEKELTLHEIEKITKTLGRGIFNVNLTGGEPFIRDDIPQIVRLYTRNAGVRYFLIATNGFLGNKIKKDIKEILIENKNIKLVVSLSLDHIGDKHDKIRGLSGLYDKVLDLYRTLLVMDPKRLFVQVNLTLQRDNCEDIENIIDHIVFKEKVRNLSLTLTRGETSDKGSGEIDTETYFKARRMIDNALKRGNLDGFRFSILNAKNQISRRIIEETIRHKKFISTCFAGTLTAVLYPNGDVYPCELYKKGMGNIKDYNYNFRSLWESPEARSIGKKISANKCFCTHECNWTTNILFNPKYFPELLMRAVNIEARKIKKKVFHA